MKTIKKPVQVEINVKKSQFICSLFPTRTKKESKEIIQKLNQQYSDATHNCTAYIASDGEGFDDDGEPGGTAGKPMINVLRKNELHNITAVVTRYFGGIKLGAGGLVRAYSKSVMEAIGEAEIVEIEEYSVLNLFLNIPTSRQRIWKSETIIWKPSISSIQIRCPMRSSQGTIVMLRKYSRSTPVKYA